MSLATRLVRHRLASLGVAVTAAVLGVATSAEAGTGDEAGAWPDAAIEAWAEEEGLSTAEAERRAARQDRAVELATRLTERLGERSAGAWLTAEGALVVNVLDAGAAATVRATGATPRQVSAGLDDLEAAVASLDALAAPAGVAYAADVTTQSVRVAVPEGVDASAFLDAAHAQGVPVTVEAVASAPATQAFYGGETILLSGGGRCSAGFVTQTSRGTPYLLTAGHCTNGSRSVSDESGTTVGNVAASSFPGNDYGAVRISSSVLDAQGGVATSGIIAGDGAGEGGVVDITSAGRVPVGGQVCKAGSTTGYTCGTVRAYNVTVTYAEGRVGGLTQTTVCTQPGDSGGALIAGSVGQGIVSGGSSNVGCGSSSFQSFFQPLDEVLQVYGLTVR